MSITPQEALQRCIEHRELSHDEMTAMMRLIMSGEMSPELVAGLLVALRTKKETVGEIAAAAISPTVSFFVRSATRKPATSSGDISPLIMSRIMAVIST